VRRHALWAGIVLLGAAVAIVYAAWPRRSDRDALLEAVKTAQVQAADFYISIPVQGVLEAARYAPIVNRAEHTQIVWVLSDGTWVGEGDGIMKLNPAEAKKRVDELEAQVAEAEEKLRQAEADGEKRMQNARSNLAKAKDAMELARLQSSAGIERGEAEVAFLEKELEVAQGELDQRQQLLKERLVAIREVEEAQDKVREAKHGLDAARRRLEQARTDATISERLKQFDVDTAQLESDDAAANLERSVKSATRSLEDKQLDLEEARERLDSTELEAVVPGMLLLEQTWDEGGSRPLRVGDEVWEGRRVARIIDPTEMLVRCDINEADIEQVEVGQPAKVRVPALGDIVLDGEVDAIDNLARQRAPWEGGVPGKRVFAALVELTSEDPRLRPGMGAAIEIVLEHVAEGAAVPLEALFPGDDGYVVHRVEGTTHQSVSVEVGKRNNRFAAVEGELEVGEVVACEQPHADLSAAAAEKEER
jgi:multidrug resistance efflux pump